MTAHTLVAVFGLASFFAAGLASFLAGFSSVFAASAFFMSLTGPDGPERVIQRVSKQKSDSRVLQMIKKRKLENAGQVDEQEQTYPWGE